MREARELVRAWIRKAESDLVAAEIAIAAGKTLDTACFHCQQAAERYLKAYLVWQGVDFPFVHNLEKLVELCSARAAEFEELLGEAAELTPFAVELRYDTDFWPTLEAAGRAQAAALKVKSFVLERLPEDVPPRGV